MYEMAKKGRDAMKAKARKLAGEKDEKVDSSDWTPPAKLNADVKTGMRPISRRAYKKGGKVTGAAALVRADRKPRKKKKEDMMAMAPQGYDDRKDEQLGMTEGPEDTMDMTMEGRRDVARATREPMGSYGLKKGGKVNYGPATMPGGKNGPSTKEQEAIERRQENASKPKRGAAGHYKKGGKVENDEEEAKDIALAKANTNRKEANEKREGIKHIGGMKKGGRAKKQMGGSMPLPPPRPSQDEIDRLSAAAEDARLARAAKDLNRLSTREYRRELEAAGAGDNAEYKKGGRAKKQMGGPMAPPNAGVPTSLLRQENSRGLRLSPMKKGGKAKWEGSAEDEKQDKKLAKKHGMSMKEWESSKMDDKHDEQESSKGLKKGGRAARYAGGRIAKQDGGLLSSMMAGEKKEKKDKKDKGRTNILINIETSPKGQHAGGMPPGGPAGGPPPMGMPPGGMPGAGPGMPPMPPGMGASPVPGGMPMPRKRGGRTVRSVKDLTAGAGSGVGRLQKTELEKRVK